MLAAGLARGRAATRRWWWSATARSRSASPPCPAPGCSAPSPAASSRSAYAAAAFAVLPSIPTPRFKEPWGLVCNEAMQQGRPMIATTAVGAVAGGLVRDERDRPRDRPQRPRRPRRSDRPPARRQRAARAPRRRRPRGRPPYTYEAMADAFDQALERPEPRPSRAPGSGRQRRLCGALAKPPVATTHRSSQRRAPEAALWRGQPLTDRPRTAPPGHGASRPRTRPWSGSAAPRTAGTACR